MENLELWEKVKQPPDWAMKKISGGRLKGMTDIKPMWRYQILTEIYGPCGDGWNYTIDRMWTDPGADGQIFAFAQVSLMINGKQPIPAVGGSMLVEKEKAGLHCNDEAFKMAVTDALSAACKVLGVGAVVYSGMVDGSKYDKQTGGNGGPKDDDGMTPKQREAVWSVGKKNGMTPADISKMVDWVADKKGLPPMSKKLPDFFLGKYEDGPNQGKWKFDVVMASFIASRAI
jgi:hypothetical protein